MLIVFIASVLILCVIDKPFMLTVIMLSVIILSVVAPLTSYNCKKVYNLRPGFFFQWDRQDCATELKTVTAIN